MHMHANSLAKKSLHSKELQSNFVGGLYYLEDVSVNYGEINALKSVHLSIDKGEIVFVTGISGSGKTTLLRVLSGEIKPDSGKVRIPQISNYGQSSFVAQVFQDLRLVPRHTIEDNLLFSYDPVVYNNRDIFVQDMIELARILGIKDRLTMKVKDANGGLKQKVAIIRALLTRPDILLADEPTSSLDANNAKKIFDVLNLYNTKRGMTVVWASHNRELVKQFIGRIVHLDMGRMIYSGHACFI